MKPLYADFGSGDTPILSHPSFREIEGSEYEGDNCFLSGVEVWNVDTDGVWVCYCELVGLRMDGVMLSPAVLAQIVGKAAMDRTREFAMERFQGEIDAGKWGQSA